jgi:GT2 family glycosyltransferase
VRTNENLGFAGGNNVGIKKALGLESEFICLLNNDTIVEPDFLTKLISKYNASIGILTPVICYYHDRKKVWAAGGRISKLRGSGFAHHFNNDVSDVREDMYVQFVSGCCMLFHKSLIHEIGYLDENYFLYLEDTDFSFRTNRINKKNLVVKDSLIYHKVNATTKKDNSLLPLYYTTRNRLYFSKKNFGPIYIITHLYLKITFCLKLNFVDAFKNNEVARVVKRAFADFKRNKFGKLTEPLG